MPVFDRGRTISASVGRTILDADLEKWLPTGPGLGADGSLAKQRASHAVLGAKPWPEIGSVEHLVLDGPHGSLYVRVHTPKHLSSTPAGALVYMHGGGWTVGTPDEFEIPMRLLANRAGIRTYLVDYRLAPEAKWPAQLEENEFVVRWLFKNAVEQGVDPSKIALGGDSAGGNMTCVLAQKLRDERGPQLALNVPLFPETALPFDTLSASENRTGLYLETAGILSFARNLLPNDVDSRQPYVTPMNAESLSDLPPTLLVTNGFDPLRDVGHMYAQKLAKAGNDITYVHHPQLTHGFPQFARYSKACHEATMQLGDLIRQLLVEKPKAEPAQAEKPPSLFRLYRRISS